MEDSVFVLNGLVQMTTAMDAQKTQRPFWDEPWGGVGTQWSGVPPLPHEARCAHALHSDDELPSSGGSQRRPLQQPVNHLVPSSPLHPCHFHSTAPSRVLSHFSNIFWFLLGSKYTSVANFLPSALSSFPCILHHLSDDFNHQEEWLTSLRSSLCTFSGISWTPPENILLWRACEISSECCLFLPDPFGATTPWDAWVQNASQSLFGSLLFRLPH